jgi:hypothetical protein
MAAGRIVVPPFFPARNRENQLLSGALLYVYTNNTTTKATIYVDAGLTIVAANPVEANSSGHFPAVFAEAGTESVPVLYSVSVTTADGGSPGNPFNFNNYRPAVDWETATLALAEAAADAAEQAAEDAQDALTEIEDIATGSPTAPSIINKLNRDVTNLDAFRTVSLEQLGAVGNGIADDSAAFVNAAAYLNAGYTVVGVGLYKISQKITYTADRNALWESNDNPRMGKLVIPGTVTSTHNGIAFESLGNQGGAAGPHIEIGSLLGPGIASTSSTGIRLRYGEHTIKIGEVVGYYTGILLDGCWSSTIDSKSIFECYRGVRGILGVFDTFTTSNNALVIRVDHVGGPFVNTDPNLPNKPLRRAQGCHIGMDLEYVYGCHIEAGDIQYCQQNTDSIGIILGAEAESNTVRAYIEGVYQYPEQTWLMRVLGKNNRIQISATLTPDNVINAVDIRGLGNKVSGIGQRTNFSSVFNSANNTWILGPERGAGMIRRRPGNPTDDPSYVIDHENANADAFNLSSQGLGIYALSSNCSRSTLSSGLPDTSNIQPGATLTINDTNIATAISPTITIASAAYDRPIYVRAWARMVTGPCAVALYLQESASNVALSKAYITQGLSVAGQWQEINLAAIIPAGQTTFRLRLSMRTVADAQTGGCVVDWAFPVISWFPDPRSQSFRPPPGPYVIPGNVQMDSLIPAKQDNRVPGNPTATDGVDAYTVTAATKSNPLTVTVPGHTYSVADPITFSDVAGMTELNSTFTITAIVGDVLTFGATNSTDWGTFRNDSGILDCNYAPLVRITSAGSNIGQLANLSQGLTTILNDTASSIDINTSTGLAAIKAITARRYVTIYKVGSSVYADV